MRPHAARNLQMCSSLKHGVLSNNLSPRTEYWLRWVCKRCETGKEAADQGFFKSADRRWGWGWRGTCRSRLLSTRALPCPPLCAPGSSSGRSKFGRRSPGRPFRLLSACSDGQARERAATNSIEIEIRDAADIRLFCAHIKIRPQRSSARHRRFSFTPSFGVRQGIKQAVSFESPGAVSRGKKFSLCSPCIHQNSTTSRNVKLHEDIGDVGTRLACVHTPPEHVGVYLRFRHYHAEDIAAAIIPRTNIPRPNGVTTRPRRAPVVARGAPYSIARKEGTSDSRPSPGRGRIPGPCRLSAFSISQTVG